MNRSINQVSGKIQGSNSLHNNISRHYTIGKKMALTLLQDIDLYITQKSNEQYIKVVEKIHKSIGYCRQFQKGEICMLICLSAIQFEDGVRYSVIQDDYLYYIRQYFYSLLQQNNEKIQTSGKLVRQAYSGRINFIKNQVKISGKKRNMIDLLLIERIDKILRLLLQNLSRKNLQFEGFNKRLLNILIKSSIFAERMLSQAQYVQFKENIDKIIQLLNALKPSCYKQQSLFEGRLMIIDQNLQTSKQKDIYLKSSSSSKLLSQIRINQKASVNLSSASTRKKDNESEKRQSIIIKTFNDSKRRSRLSTLSKRSSLVNSQEKTTRVSARLMNTLITDMLPNSLSKNKVVRRSNFQQIKRQEIDNLIRSGTVNFGNNPIIQQQSNHQKQLEMTINSFFVEELIQFLKKMHPFYIFIQEQGILYLGLVEEIKNQQSTIEQELSFEIRISTFNSLFRLGHKIYNQFKHQSKEQACLRSLRDLKFYKNMQMNLQLQQRQTDYNQTSFHNIFAIERSRESFLLGFIRQVSTYFVSICKYKKQDLKNHYQFLSRKKMLEHDTSLKFQIEVNKKLMNTDLIEQFQKWSAVKVSRGSIIQYIQMEAVQTVNTARPSIECKLRSQYNSIKLQPSEIKLKLIWYRDNIQIEHPEHFRKKRSRKHGISKLNKYCQSEFGNKKLKRANKNSLKISGGELVSEKQFFKTCMIKNNFREQIRQSSKRIITEQPINIKNRKKLVHKKQHNYIESIKTQKGYKLILFKAKQEITGIKNEIYYGFRQRNPQLCNYQKGNENKESSKMNANYLKPFLSLRGKKTKVKGIVLITFTKRVVSDNGIQNYLIITIKLLPNENNHWVYIEVYWQNKQNSDIFQRMTEINTKNYLQRSFVHLNENNIKRDKRTSVVQSIFKNKQIEMSQNSRTKLKNCFNEDYQRIDQNFQFAKPLMKSKFNLGTNHLTDEQLVGLNSNFRAIKTLQILSTTKLLKNSYKNIHKKDTISRLKTKFVKFVCFTWKEYTLRLNVYKTNSTQVEQTNFSFEGHQLATKNIHCMKNNKVTQLILVKYNENSLSNLNFYNIGGLNKIYLEHMYIKNNSQLYGFYISQIRLKQIAEDMRMDLNYKQSNKFFEKNQMMNNSKPNNFKAKPISSKASILQQQKKFKYQSIINMAKNCSVSYNLIQKKKNKLMQKRFIIPNRYSNIDQAEYMLEIQLNQEIIKINQLNGEVIMILKMDILEKYFPYILKINCKKLRQFIHRILKDDDIIRLCMIDLY